MADQFENWRKRLAGEKIPTYETEPDPGYYRKPIKERTEGGASKKVGWIAVSFWRDTAGAMICNVGINAEITDKELQNKMWLDVVRYPITEELYFDVVDKGAPWPDMPHEPPAQPTAGFSLIAADLEEQAEKVAEHKASIGHNNPPADDPLAAMREQIESAVGAAKDIKVTSKDAADAAQAFRARLNELANNADKVRKGEKAPHEAKAKEVDAKYMPLVKMAKEAADRIRDQLNAFATELLRQQREAERKAEADRAEIELQARRRAQAEADRKAAMEKGDEPPPLPPAAPAPSQPVQTAVTTIKGASGKAAGVATVKYAVITDWDATVAHYAGDRAVRDLVQKLADRDAKAGLQVPGAAIEERADVR